MPAGAIYTTEDNNRVHLSLLAAMATDQNFTLTLHAGTEFPVSDRHSNSPDLANDHFLIQCSRLVYEDAAVIQDVIESRYDSRQGPIFSRQRQEASAFPSIGILSMLSNFVIVSCLAGWSCLR